MGLIGEREITLARLLKADSSDNISEGESRRVREGWKEAGDWKMFRTSSRNISQEERRSRSGLEDQENTRGGVDRRAGQNRTGQVRTPGGLQKTSRRIWQTLEF